jgi:hypothetical protein
MRGQWGRDVNQPLPPRVREHDSACEQVEPFLDAARQLPILPVKIFSVADDRVADRGGVNAKLVRAPRHRLQRRHASFWAADSTTA